ncbi:MAG TPA: DUF192 domain-containing protein [Devosia sp.]|nr:DUF192 domain-containing protein [Devosia sp.]
MLVTACSGGQERLVLHTRKGDVPLTVEIADTDQSRAKGLMFRQSIDDDKGMLFDFQQERQVSFWMRNTFIPLDMIFIAADGTIRNIHANARPQDPTSIPSDGPVRFVLEIGGGRAAELGLKAGDTISHPRVEK